MPIPSRGEGQAFRALLGPGRVVYKLSMAICVHSSSSQEGEEEEVGRKYRVLASEQDGAVLTAFSSDWQRPLESGEHFPVEPALQCHPVSLPSPWFCDSKSCVPSVTVACLPDHC